MKILRTAQSLFECSARRTPRPQEPLKSTTRRLTSDSPSPRGVVVVTWLALLALTCPPASWAQTPPTAEWENRIKSYTEALPNVANRCHAVRAYIVNGPAARPTAMSDVAALDDDLASATILQGNETLELHFIGAPRWINRVNVAFAGSSAAVELLHGDGEWRTFAEWDGVFETDGVATGSATRATGLRIHSGLVGDELALFEVAAFFDQPGDFERGIENGATTFQFFYEWVGNYPGRTRDLPNTRPDARGLRDQLPGTWNKEGYGDADAWETDWKLEAQGGRNNRYADSADLVYFAGHGTRANDPVAGARRTALLFGNQARNDCCLVPSEVRAGFGDSEAEWVCFSACRMFRDRTNRNAWVSSWNGLHQMLGFQTVMSDVRFGRPFGRYLVDSGIFDSPVTVAQSWMDVAELTHGANYVAVALAENATMWNDFIHGQGAGAQADPAVDNVYNWWSYRTTAATAAVSEPVTRPRLTNPRTILPESEAGVPIAVSDDLLDAPFGVPQALRYDVIPTARTVTDIADIAQRMCTESGLFCAADVGPADGGESINGFDGAWSLRAAPDCSLLHVENVDAFLRFRTSPPVLLDDATAVAEATSLLQAWQLLPADAQFERTDFLMQGETEQVSPGVFEDVAALTFDSAIRVVFRRHLDGLPVAGPGGELTMLFGDAGQFVRMISGPWRTVSSGTPVDLVPLGDVLQKLADQGSDATVAGITLDFEAIQVNGSELGYFEYGCDRDQSMLRPVYQLDVTFTEAGGALINDRIHLYADALPVAAEITGPEKDVCVLPDTELCFEATADCGVPPFEFEWETSSGEALGSGPVFCTTFGQLDDPDKPLHRPTISVTVTDSLGSVSRDSIQVTVSRVGDVNCDGVVSVGDIGPFVLAITDPQAYAAQFPDCDLCNADCTNNGVVSVGDINCFVAILTAD